MSTAIEQPRHFCTLGAQQSVVAIERAIPIIHAGPGCSGKLWGGLSFCNGFQGAGYAGGGAIPCTNSGEREVVFGGEERLRQVIEGALKVMDADLFVVLTGCTADIVGDDTATVVREFRAEGVPIVFAETGLLVGFFLPGDSLLFTAGFLASLGVMDVRFLLAGLAIAAVATAATSQANHRAASCTTAIRERAAGTNRPATTSTAPPPAMSASSAVKRWTSSTDITPSFCRGNADSHWQDGQP